MEIVYGNPGFLNGVNGLYEGCNRHAGIDGPVTSPRSPGGNEPKHDYGYDNY